MSFFRPRSLRGQLVGLVAALAVPLVALQVWWGYRESQSAEKVVATEALAIADATALSVRQFLTQAEAGLTGESADFGLQFVTGAACDAAMQALTNMFPFLSNVIAVDRDGSVVCSADPTAGGTSAVEWAWFADIAEDPRYAVGSPVLSIVDSAWILPLVAPILDEQGRFAGAIVGAAPLLGFARLMSGDRGAQDVLITIATPGRIVVARSADAGRWVGQPLPALLEREGTSESVGPGRATARGPDFEDIDRKWGEVELENGWWVYAGVPVETIFGPARAAAARHIGITLLIVLLGMLLAARSYGRIGSALRELETGIRVTKGGGAVPVPAGTPIEFRAVVEQFNETLRSRNRAEDAERATLERYQSIFDNAVFGLFVATADGRFLEVNASLVSMLGYESAPALIDAGPDALYASPG
jgi:PAS domain-containing protein